MKVLAAAGWAAAILGAILATSLSSLSRKVDSLGSRLEISEADLESARREIGRLRLEGEETAGRLEEELADRASQAETRARRESPGTPQPRTGSVEALYRDVLHPSVQVSGRGGVGGGTLLYSRGGRSYVITAYHVVQKPPAKKESEQGSDTIEVKLYDDRGIATESVEGILAAHDEKKDLALLRLRSAKTYPNVARLASRESLRAIKVFTPVYAVGCPLGHDPLPTLGEVATLNKDVSGERFWMMNAPTIFGNSGGGIFHRDTRELIGVSAMICTYDGVVSTPVPHLGILVSLEAVYDWLDMLGHRFVYDPDGGPETCGSDPEEEEPADGPALPPARRGPLAQIEW